MSVDEPETLRLARASPIAFAADAAAARLREWLLTGPAQIRGSDAEAGGVAGVLDVDGKPRYVYAEITGYYLGWLADITAVAPLARIRERARLAVAWSQRALGREGQLPQTRIYLDATEPDWRNDAVFFFDLAMLLHGIEAATAAGIVAEPATLRGVLHAHLLTFVSAGQLRCAIQVRGTAALPPRWSTGGGAFLVKASSRVALGARHPAFPDALALACARDIDQWVAGAGDIDLDMLHPTLYFAEGMLLARPDRADAVAKLLQRSLVLTQADGSLPETADGTPRTRNDILAQALRVGVLLRELETSGAPSVEALDRLASTLLERIGERSFLTFNTEAPAQANVWCTMFAEQALRWHAGMRLGHARRPSAAALV